MTGLDIHGGLRIRLEYNKATRSIVAKFDAEHDGSVRQDVEQYLARFDQKAGYARQWLAEFDKQEAARSLPTAGGEG